MQKILVVDDEATLCEAVQLNLELEGYHADTALSAEQALRMNPAGYDLLILDVMLGGMDGFELARRLKADPATARVPVIFCTALGDDDDQVRGLDIGADDYLPKPYSMRCMMARVRSVLRRNSASAEQPSGIAYEGINVDLEAKVCTVDGQVVKMPRKELEILALLLANRGRVFSREEILARVWDDDVVVCDRTIDVNIARVRQKLGPYGRHIVTRSGYGYGFRE